MESAPPSYETATTLINPWQLVAPYLPIDTLRSAALVSRTWHAIFTPYLWGNPASLLRAERDHLYSKSAIVVIAVQNPTNHAASLAKFQTTLPRARSHVRAYTHTLRLYPAPADSYYSPHEAWLRDVLERLEHLQTLVVRGLPFFDHGALTALRTKPHAQPFSLRLLDASKCVNATPSGLLIALERLDQLLYLDLSFTYAAKDHKVLAQLSSCIGLRVLKLRGLGIKDQDVQVLAHAIGYRVRSLDIRNNKITDEGVRHLVECCFTPPDVTGNVTESRREAVSRLQSLGPVMLRIYQGDGLDAYLRRTLSAGFVSRLAFEDAPESGITHLHIAGNHLSTKGVSGLLWTKRLHVLDVRVDVRLPNKLVRPDGTLDIIHPGAEKLPLALYKGCGVSLTYLKINHELITQRSPDFHPTTDVHASPDSWEAAPWTDPPALPARPINSAQRSLPVTTNNNINSHGASSGRDDPIGSSIPPSLNGPATTTPDTSPSAHSLPSQPPATDSPSPVLSSNNPFRPVPKRTLSDLKLTRYGHHSSLDPTIYHPSTTPHLRTLVLTSFPSHSLTSDPIDRLVSYLSSCATEHRLATQIAEADYSLPPGRRSPEHLREAARKSFALETVVLEVIDTGSGRVTGSAAGRKGKGIRNDGGARGSAGEGGGWKGQSMTDDRDGAALWETAKGDFSFFGESGERADWLEEEGGEKSEYTANSTDLPREKEEQVQMSAVRRDVAVEAEITGIDNIAVLGKWRRERKAAWEERGEVEGYWPGTVRVVRVSGSEEDEGEEN
ncbi:hypothetical protein CAC42_1562 [Sphaceloma murrayae]|uniref:F-box domain-containing protein n=1 Tax=Sphaceloma murrayae TaxID=2082308 RepID=A0A2K1R360_9PEZI|nr:hypothetical protein CAC42_1562 [Sphaceloma murrayae]